MQIHHSLTIEVISAGAERTMFELENVGFCIACGAEHDACEPDAEKYHCDSCNSNTVYGAELLLLMTVA